MKNVYPKAFLSALLFLFTLCAHAEQLTLEKQEVCDLEKHLAETSPLHAAAFKGDAKALASAIEKGGDVNQKTSSLFCNGLGAWLTPLHLAAQKGSLECVKLLLDKNADVNAYDFQTRTPLHHACLIDSKIPLETRLAILKLLIEKKADVNYKDNDDRTPLDMLAENETNKAARKYLVSQHAVSGKK